MSLNEFFNSIRDKVRIYLRYQDDEIFPIMYLDLTSANKKRSQSDNPELVDFPETKPLLIAQSSRDFQNKARSQHFLNLMEKADDTYQRIICINRAIDYDMINIDTYNRAINYYKTLIEEGVAFASDLEQQITYFQSIIKKIEEFYTSSCTVPILFDMEAKKRVELDTWVLNNRRVFPTFINERFVREVNRDDRHPQYMWDANKGIISPVELFKHQKFISDFISEQTPYRGCLLYYGLGSGKTLSSINVAEGCDRQVVVFLPASLRNNYLKDLKEKGSTLYHKQNQWCFFPMKNYLEPDNLEILKKMGFPTDKKDLLARIFIQRGPDNESGFWCVQKKVPGDNITLKNNTESFTKEQQEDIARTVNTLREFKYQFVHYNSSGDILRYLMINHLGTETKAGGKSVSIYEQLVEPALIEEMLEESDENYKTYADLSTAERKNLRIKLLDTIFKPDKTDARLKLVTNPLDNKLIVIDEVHNFISMICNGSDKGTKIYQLIMRANNLKIVTLSGTPIINSPFELAVLFNLLRGYSVQYHFTQVNKTETYRRKEIEAVLKTNPYIEQYKFIDLEKTFMISRIPFGYKKVNENEVSKDLDSPSDEQLFQQIIEDIKNAGAGSYRQNGDRNDYQSAFPDIFSKKSAKGIFKVDKKSIDKAKEEFYNSYIDKKEFKIINENDFMYRSLGLVSFYNEISEYNRDLFPKKIQSDVPDYVNMSDFQLISYENAREYERQLEERQKKDDKKKANAAVFEIDTKISNLFKVFSRQRLLFTFPPGIERPIIKNLKEKLVDKVIAKENVELKKHKLENAEIGAENETKYRNINKLKQNTKKALEKLYKEETLKCLADLKNNPRFLTINEGEYALQVLSPKFAQMLQNIADSPGLVFGYSQFRSVEGIEIFGLVLEANGYERIEFLESRSSDGEEIVEIKPTDSMNHIFSVGDMVRYEMNDKTWRSYRIEYISDDMTEVKLCGLYKPGNTVGLLEEGVWKSYQVESIEDGQVKLVDKVETISELVSAFDCYRCRFAIWSGTETDAQRDAITETYKSIENLFGQKIMILLTTSSGSEGINLKYVRQVHIMEPYWNRVRVEQVIGRARRIESHVLLPIDQRNVRIFMYVSNFTKEQLEGNWGTDTLHGSLEGIDKCLITDISQSAPEIVEEQEAEQKLSLQQKQVIQEITNNINMADKGRTSDEALLLITNRKYDIIKKFLDLIKRSAVDCVYNRKANISSDPELANVKCLERVEGTNIYAYNLGEAPKSHEVGFLERAIKKTIYRMPYNTSREQLLNIIYEADVDTDLMDITDPVPVFNFYTYYGINPLKDQDISGSRELIGSISRDTDAKQLKLVINQNFIQNADIFETVENIIGDRKIPNFADEVARVKFVDDIIHDARYRDILSGKIAGIEEEVQKPLGEKPKGAQKRMVKLNIRKTKAQDAE